MIRNDGDEQKKTHAEINNYVFRTRFKMNVRGTKHHIMRIKYSVAAHPLITVHPVH